MKQQSFFPKSFKAKAFGGERLKSNPKIQRPISLKLATHLVLKSSQARGKYSMIHLRKVIDGVLQSQAQKFRVKIYQKVNVGNHLHLLVRFSSRREAISWLRAISGLIARKVLGVERGTPANRKFWDCRPWTAVVTWGLHFKHVQKYLVKNFNEVVGLENWLRYESG